MSDLGIEKWWWCLCIAFALPFGALALDGWVHWRKSVAMRRTREERTLMVTDNYHRCPRCGSTAHTRFSRYTLVNGEYQEHWHCDVCGEDYRYVNENPTSEPHKVKQADKAKA